MDFDDYQREAARTDRLPDDDGLVMALLGLGGEVGSIQAEFKKWKRDGAAHSLFVASIAEELGDVLWYAARIASRLQIDLNEVAVANLAKAQERWGPVDGGDAPPRMLPDAPFPPNERFPRVFDVNILEVEERGKRMVRMYLNGEELGAPLRDNAYSVDGYRFHDVFHLAYAAKLGWSPVLRKLMGRKRRSNPVVDEVEDGGRAIVIEEAVAAFVYEYAKRHAFLKGVDTLDYRLLRTIKSLTKDLEGGRATLLEWEHAIIGGYEVWRQVDKYRGGRVRCDLEAREFSFVQPPVNT